VLAVFGVLLVLLAVARALLVVISATVAGDEDGGVGRLPASAAVRSKVAEKPPNRPACGPCALPPSQPSRVPCVSTATNLPFVWPSAFSTRN